MTLLTLAFLVQKFGYRWITLLGKAYDSVDSREWPSGGLSCTKV
jgi:hypothetical protein